MKKFWLISFCIISIFCTSKSIAQIQKPKDWDPKDKDTVFAIVPDRETQEIKEIKGKYKIKAPGTSIEKDKKLSSSIQFKDDPKSEISFHYYGPEDILKGRGFTLEAWIKPGPDTLKDASFLLKFGTLATAFKNDVLKVQWLSLPTEKIYIEPDSKRLDYHPLAQSFAGTIPLKMSKWNHIAISYDEKLQQTRTWINGGIDRDKNIQRKGQQWIKMPEGDLYFFRRLKNSQIGGIRMRVGAHEFGEAPPMKAYLNQLPWQGKMVLTIDSINPKLKLPIEMLALLPDTKPGRYRKTLNSHKTASLEIPFPKMWTTIRPINLKVYAGGQQVFATTINYNNKRPDMKKDGVSINPDKSVSINGKKIFPRFLYGVRPDEMETVKGMGFNIVGGKDPKGMFIALGARDMEGGRAFIKGAEEANMHVTFAPNFQDSNFTAYMNEYKKSPALFFWYCADEPWKDWERYRNNYNLIRSIDQQHPVFTVVNMELHMKEAATICDIFASDPYPIPSVSLRGVSQYTESAVRASFGLKPIWTVLATYKGKLPTLQELRCMSILAICAGSNGLGIYTYSDELKRNGKWIGYAMRKHPEVKELVSSVMNDVAKIENILVEPNIPKTVSINKDQPALHTSIKKAKGKTYLFLANDSRKAESGTISLKTKKSAIAEPLPQFGYKDTLKFTNGKCKITVPPLGAGVFELK